MSLDYFRAGFAAPTTYTPPTTTPTPSVLAPTGKIPTLPMPVTAEVQQPLKKPTTLGAYDDPYGILQYLSPAAREAFMQNLDFGKGQLEWNPDTQAQWDKALNFGVSGDQAAGEASMSGALRELAYKRENPTALDYNRYQPLNKYLASHEGGHKEGYKSAFGQAIWDPKFGLLVPNSALNPFEKVSGMTPEQMATLAAIAVGGAIAAPASAGGAGGLGAAGTSTTMADAIASGVIPAAGTGAGVGAGTGLATLPNAGTWANTAAPTLGAGAGEWTLPAALTSAGAGGGAGATTFEQIVNGAKNVGSKIMTSDTSKTLGTVKDLASFSQLFGGGGGGVGASTGGSQVQTRGSAADQAAHDALLQEILGVYGGLKTNPVPYGKAAPVGPSADTLAAQEYMRNFASQSAPIYDQLRGSLSTGLNAMDVANNPYVKAAVEAAQRRLSEQYTDPGGIMSTIRINAAQTGNVGSSRQGVAEGVASGRFANAAGDISAQMYSDAYNKGMDTYIRTLGLAPQILESSLLPGKTLSAVGQDVEGYGQRTADYEAGKTNYEAGYPVELLKQIVALVNGQQPLTTSTENTVDVKDPSFLQKLAGGASTGLGLLSLYKSIFG